MLGMLKDNEAELFKDVEGRDLLLVGRFHADFCIAIFGNPFEESAESFGKGIEACLFIFGTSNETGNTYAGINPYIVNVRHTTVL